MDLKKNFPHVRPWAKPPLSHQGQCQPHQTQAKSATNVKMKH